MVWILEENCIYEHGILMKWGSVSFEFYHEQRTAETRP